MNPFKHFEGMRINGRLYAKKELLKASMDADQPAHMREVFAFAAKAFDKSKHLKVTTSGSTGKPKKMDFPKSAFVASAKATNAFFGLSAKSEALLALPMRYIVGKMMVVRAIVGGYNLDVMEPASVPFSGKDKSYDLVPLTPYQALQSLEAQPKSVVSQRAILIGGGMLSDELRRKLVLAEVRAYASFGMTETLSHFAIATLSNADEPEYRLLKNVEIKIRKSGQLRVKWKDVTHSWLETNDLVAPTKHGFTWMGRADNLINSGGIKVMPEQVEKRLAHLIHVPFFVVGISHPKLGEEVALIIEAEGLPASDLLAEVQHALSDTPFWQPRRLLTMSRFTYTATGKVVRGDTVKRFVEEGR